ncbi:hypothetical protein HK105_203853 [Polyrhizophydium stewartii]|uniref:Uncharacterized protein n=1 Tax=Polyrhizophydium stewartii TaxID=2732419 RepID=A0ABR4NB39_9FUNG
MIKVVLVSLLVVAAALIYVPVRQLIGVGHVLSSYGNENTESCRLVEHPLLRGCEDGELHAETGTIFFACAINLADRSGWFPPLELANRSVVGSGGIVALDTKTLTPRRLAFESHDGEFTPHGIGLLLDPADAGKLIVHAVNHRRDGSVVDMFEHTLGSTTLLRIGTARNARLLASPNDVQPVGRTAFYATNDLATHGFLRQIEMLLSLRWSHVTYFERRGGADDTGAAAGGIDKWIVAAEHLAYPNGMLKHMKCTMKFPSPRFR